jgi:uncharacterized protein YggT (Ycf19 family)
VVWFLAGLVDVILAIRFVMKLLGANPTSGFVSFMYNISEPLAAPFRAIFWHPRRQRQLCSSRPAWSRSSSIR